MHRGHHGFQGEGVGLDEGRAKDQDGAEEDGYQDLPGRTLSELKGRDGVEEGGGAHGEPEDRDCLAVGTMRPSSRSMQPAAPGCNRSSGPAPHGPRPCGGPGPRAGFPPGHDRHGCCGPPPGTSHPRGIAFEPTESAHQRRGVGGPGEPPRRPFPGLRIPPLDLGPAWVA